MYRIRNSYGECSVLELNLMCIQDNKKSGISTKEALFLSVMVISFLLLIIIATGPAPEFFAQCQNIQGGDVCHIRMGSWE